MTDRSRAPRPLTGDRGADGGHLSPGPTTAISPLVGWRATFGSLRNPHFRVLVAGSFLVSVAMQVSMVARPWLAYHIAGTALGAGLVAIAAVPGLLVCSLIGGVVSDRLPKRRVLIVAHLVMFLLALANAVLVQLDIIALWHLFALNALQAAAFPFVIPARMAYIRELVPREQVSGAIAVNATAMNVTFVLGPVVAGLLIAANPTVAFYVMTLFYGAATLTLLRLPPSVVRKGQGTGAMADLAIGIAYVWNHPTLRTIMALTLVVTLLGMPYQPLLPVFQASVFRIGTENLSLMYGLVGAGALLGSLIVARLSATRRMGLVVIVAGIAFGVGLALFSLSPSYAMALPFLFMCGLASQTFHTMNSVLLVLNAKGDLVGRVTGLAMMFWALMPAAVLPMGALFDAVGPPTTLAASGMLLAGLVAAIALLRPAMWRAGSKAWG